MFYLFFFVFFFVLLVICRFFLRYCCCFHIKNVEKYMWQKKYIWIVTVKYSYSILILDSGGLILCYKININWYAHNSKVSLKIVVGCLSFDIKSNACFFPVFSILFSWKKKGKDVLKTFLFTLMHTAHFRYGFSFSPMFCLQCCSATLKLNNFSRWFCALYNVSCT